MLRDIQNFLAGRDVMDARVVDSICRRVQDDPVAQGRVARAFNNVSANMEGLASAQPSDKLVLAVAKTMQQPEFHDIRDRMIETSRAIQQASEGFLINEELGEAMKDNPRVNQYGEPSLYAQMKPEDAEILVCDPNFMDPLVRVSNMKPIDQGHLDDFNKALLENARPLYKMDDEEFRAETIKNEDVGQDLLKRFSLAP